MEVSASTVSRYRQRLLSHDYGEDRKTVMVLTESNILPRFTFLTHRTIDTMCMSCKTLLWFRLVTRPKFGIPVIGCSCTVDESSRNCFLCDEAIKQWIPRDSYLREIFDDYETAHTALVFWRTLALGQVPTIVAEYEELIAELEQEILDYLSLINDDDSTQPENKE